MFYRDGMNPNSNDIETPPVYFLCAFKQPNPYKLVKHALYFCIFNSGFNMDV